MKILNKITKFLIIFILITGWIFSGFPQIFNPSTLSRTGFPPEIQETNLSTILFLTAIFVFAILKLLTPPALTVGAGFLFLR